MFSVSASAQSELKALYDNDSMKIGITIPLSVNKVFTSASASISSVEIVETDLKDVCRVSKDPFIRDIVLLKCDEPASVSILVQVIDGANLFRIEHGPIEILELRAGFREPVVTPTPTPVQVDPEVAEGRALLIAGATLKNNPNQSQSCLNCHGSPTSTGDLRKKSSAQLSAAFSKSAMSNLAPLSAEQLRKLSKYLMTVNSAGEWP